MLRPSHSPRFPHTTLIYNQRKHRPFRTFRTWAQTVCSPKGARPVEAARFLFIYSLHQVGRERRDGATASLDATNIYCSL